MGSKAIRASDYGASAGSRLGLPTLKFRQPTTEDLENPSVITLGREQREDLKQRRTEIDKQKGYFKMETAVAKIQSKLTETKQKLTADEGELNRLREQRGRLFVEDSTKHKVQIEKLDNTIDQLRNFITNTPACIVVLEEQLAEAKQKQTADDRADLLNTQKILATSCKDLSKKLVAELEKVCGINDLLKVKYLQYQSLLKKSSMDMLGNRFAEPSMGMLQYMFDVMKLEQNEGKHNRKLPQPSPQI